MTYYSPVICIQKSYLKNMTKNISHVCVTEPSSSVALEKSWEATTYVYSAIYWAGLGILIVGFKKKDIFSFTCKFRVSHVDNWKVDIQFPSLSKLNQKNLHFSFHFVSL